LGLLPRGTITVLILAVVLFAAIQYVPVYFDAWQFHDAIRQEVKFAATSQRTIDSVRDSILRQAEEFGIPLDGKRLVVASQGPFFAVDISYSVPINLRLFRHSVEFDWRLTGETFQ
jgi:hypothetical protein